MPKPLQRCMNGIVVYPVLVEAIGNIMNYYQNQGYDGDETDYSNRRWFKAIELQANNKGFDLSTMEDSQTVIADTILGGITSDALKYITDIKGYESEDEDNKIGGVD